MIIFKIEDEDSRLMEVGIIHSISIPGNGSERGENSSILPRKTSYSSSSRAAGSEFLRRNVKIFGRKFSSLSSSVDQLDGILGFPSSSPRLTLEFHLSLEDSKLSSQTGWRNSNFQSGFPNFAIRNSKISSKEIWKSIIALDGMIDLLDGILQPSSSSHPETSDSHLSSQSLEKFSQSSGWNPNFQSWNSKVWDGILKFLPRKSENPSARLMESSIRLMEFFNHRLPRIKKPQIHIFPAKVWKSSPGGSDGFQDSIPGIQKFGREF